jgi:hypothetical protein
VAAQANYDGRSSNIPRRLRQRIAQAVDATAGANGQRERAWRQFILEPDGNEADDRSAIQSADVNSMVTAVLAQCVGAFAGDDVVSFEANNADDEAQSKAESRAVNKVLIQQNGGFARLLDGVQNALLYRAGRIKVWWETDRQRETYTVPDVEPDELSVAIDTEGQLGVEKRVISYDEDAKEAKIEQINTSQRLAMAAVDASQFFVDPDWTEHELQGCPLCGEVHYKTRDELSRMGVPWRIVKQLKAVNKFSGPQRINERRGDNANQVEPVVFLTEICEVFEAYAVLSFDDDADRAYLYRCWLGDWVQGTNDAGWLMDPEPVTRVPYASGSAFPIANRHEGEALADKLYSIQSAKTSFYRQWFDNVQVNSIGRVGVVVGQVEVNDVTNPKAGGPIRLKSPSAIVPIPVNDVGQSIGAAIAMLDKDRTERGGASVDFLGGEMQLAQDTAAGTERVYSAKELLVSYMMRNLAESMIKGAFLLAHAELRSGQSGPISIKLGEQWQQVDPATWPARQQCNVKVGYSAGERARIGQALGLMIQQYFGALQAGLEGQLVTLQGLYKLCCDFLQMNLIDNPESYFIDPTSPQAQQAAQQKQQAQQEQMRMQAQILALPEQIRAQGIIERSKLEDASHERQEEMKSFVALFKTVFEGTLDNNQAEMEGAINVTRAANEAKIAQVAGAGGGANGAGKGANGSGAGGRGGKSRSNGNTRGSRNSSN